MPTDVVLNTDAGYFDISWTDSGDIDMASTLDTAILMSILEERRATVFEIPEASLRRGWIGNESATVEQGSKTWLFEQERLTNTMLAELGTVIRNALQWLIDDGVATSVEVAQPSLVRGRVVVYIDLGRDESKVDRRYYELWDYTGGGLNF